MANDREIVAISKLSLFDIVGTNSVLKDSNRVEEFACAFPRELVKTLSICQDKLVDLWIVEGFFLRREIRIGPLFTFQNNLIDLLQ